MHNLHHMRWGTRFAALGLALSACLLSGCLGGGDDDAITPVAATPDVTKDPAAATNLVQTEAAKTDATADTTEPRDAAAPLATDDTSETS